MHPSDAATLIVVLSILIGGLWVLSTTSIAKAIAARISGNASRDVTGQIDGMRQEVEELRYQLTETQERLDFAERVLAKPKAESVERQHG